VEFFEFDNGIDLIDLQANVVINQDDMLMVIEHLLSEV
jgi:hypothetical protein